uniref:DNA-binding protein n=1 Tax=Streptomyces sp. NBC_00093 TaxID=2975649 RepID=A0AAU1ZZ99_9ACTN
MGYELRRWLADRLPAGLSSGERLVALEIADQAHDGTRAANSPDVLEIVARRTGLSGVKQVGKVLGKLSAGGIELRVPLKDPQGQPLRDKAGRIVFACAGHRTTFRVPDDSECPALKVPPVGDQTDSERSPAGETIEPERSPERGANQGERSPAGGTNRPEWSPAGGTLTAQRTTSTTTTTSPAAAAETDSPGGTLFDEPTPAAAAATAPKQRGAASRPEEPQLPEAFEAFWKTYPRRTEKRDAVRAWNKALRIGIPPERIVRAAGLYAEARHGEPSRFTKHPATWLNKGCYDDEPELVRPERGMPHANTQDQDLYDRGI